MDRAPCDNFTLQRERGHRRKLSNTFDVDVVYKLRTPKKRVDFTSAGHICDPRGLMSNPFDEQELNLDLSNVNVFSSSVNTSSRLGDHEWPPPDSSRLADTGRLKDIKVLERSLSRQMSDRRAAAERRRRVRGVRDFRRKDSVGALTSSGRRRAMTNQQLTELTQAELAVIERNTLEFKRAVAVKTQHQLRYNMRRQPRTRSNSAEDMRRASMRNEALFRKEAQAALERLSELEAAAQLLARQRGQRQPSPKATPFTSPDGPRGAPGPSAAAAGGGGGAAGGGEVAAGGGGDDGGDDGVGQVQGLEALSLGTSYLEAAKAGQAQGAGAGGPAAPAPAPASPPGKGPAAAAAAQRPRLDPKAEGAVLETFMGLKMASGAARGPRPGGGGGGLAGAGGGGGAGRPASPNSHKGDIDQLWLEEEGKAHSPAIQEYCYGAEQGFTWIKVDWERLQLDVDTPRRLSLDLAEPPEPRRCCAECERAATFSLADAEPTTENLLVAAGAGDLDALRAFHGHPDEDEEGETDPETDMDGSETASVASSEGGRESLSSSRSSSSASSARSGDSAGSRRSAFDSSGGGRRPGARLTPAEQARAAAVATPCAALCVGEALPLDRAARAGRLEAVEWLHRRCRRGASTDAMDDAAGRGHLGIVQWLHHNRTEGCTKKAMEEAAINGHLHVAEWLAAHRKEGCGYFFLDKAAAANNLACLEWMCEARGQRCTKKAMDHAAAHGNLAMVEYLQRRFPAVGCTPAALDGACKRGHLRVAEWLHAHRREGGTAKAMDGAAAGGHLDVVEWLHAHRAEGCTPEAMDNAASQGHLGVVLWLHQHYPEQRATPLAMAEAAGAGHLAVLKFLHEHQKTEIPEFAFRKASENFQEEVQVWLDFISYQKKQEEEAAAAEEEEEKEDKEDGITSPSTLLLEDAGFLPEVPPPSLCSSLDTSTKGGVQYSKEDQITSTSFEVSPPRRRSNSRKRDQIESDLAQARILEERLSRSATEESLLNISSEDDAVAPPIAAAVVLNNTR